MEKEGAKVPKEVFLERGLNLNFALETENEFLPTVYQVIQLPTAGQAMEAVGEHTTFNFPKQLNFCVHSKCSALYLQKNAALSPHP